MHSQFNRVLPILDVDADFEPLIRENIRLHRQDSLYAKFQQSHKRLALSLHASVEDALAQQQGQYSPEVRVPSLHCPVSNKHAYNHQSIIHPFIHSFIHSVKRNKLESTASERTATATAIATAERTTATASTASERATTAATATEGTTATSTGTAATASARSTGTTSRLRGSAD